MLVSALSLSPPLPPHTLSHTHLHTHPHTYPHTHLHTHHTRINLNALIHACTLQNTHALPLAHAFYFLYYFRNAGILRAAAHQPLLVSPESSILSLSTRFHLIARLSKQLILKQSTMSGGKKHSKDNIDEKVKFFSNF